MRRVGRGFWALLALGLGVVAACGGDDDDGGAAGGSGGAAVGGGQPGGGGSGPGAGAGGGTSAGGGGGGGPVGGDACEGAEEHEGEGTYYDFADGSGNCSFPATPGDPFVAAMNATDYAGSAACGACIALTGPKGSVTVRIVDQCPECPAGDVDLHPGAFDRIAERAAGRVPIRWTYVPCEVSGPAVFHFKDGSSGYWTAVQVRNHRFAIASVEYKKADGSWAAMGRESYNYFVEPAGFGTEGPYALRATDVRGGVVQNEAVAAVEEGEVEAGGQFPACE
ncbi:MAG TPA: expansin EXLX1 family cellulose-binding protein [Polyangiaceae bacterium]|nr:expansin EXLX1 family cellulose-binding protein [Polyangiaceae bacterium]